MNIALISADDEFWACGMRSISAVLREAGHSTTMFFAGAPGVPIDESLRDEIAELAGDPEIIAISSMSRGSTRAKDLIAMLRPLARPIVWGGVHPTLFPEDCIGHADIVCRGEGEGFMLELVERVASGGDFSGIPNGAYRAGGRPVLNDLRPLIDDLDRLPLLDYAFEEEYLLDASGRLMPNAQMRQMTRILFSGSRGCRNSCTYCSNSQLKSMYRGLGRYDRKMSIPRFVWAAREYQRIFPRLKRFYFTDEDFFARPVEEMRELAEIYPAEVGLPYECMASPRQITEEKMALAVRAGLFQIDVGLESGSRRVRYEIFHRPIDDEVQMNAADVINKHAPGSALYFLILGNPYEEREDLLAGIRLLERLSTPFRLRIYNLVFIPGTKLFEKARLDGIIGGIDDSAFEMDFVGGFDHRDHDWKRNNLYLNGLIALMCGRFTAGRTGSIPRAALPLLTGPRMVDFCDRHPAIGEAVVFLGNLRRQGHTLATALPHRAYGYLKRTDSGT